MGVHDNFAALAQKLITKDGRTVQVKTTTRTPVNPAEPWGADNESDSLASGPGVFLDPDAATTAQELLIQLSQGLTAQERTDVTGESTNVWLAALDFPNGVKDTDTLVDGTTEWEIVSVKKIQPGPTIIAYLLEVSV